jgi:hypothetical protein
VRNSFLSMPEGEPVADVRVHELVRDYPELLAFFSARGLALPRVGSLTLETAFLSGGGRLEEVLGITSWRAGTGA